MIVTSKIPLPLSYPPETTDSVGLDTVNVVDSNRRGIIEQFPLTSISIAVLEIDSKIYKTTLEIGEVASQIKHKAKAVLGSTYVINKRRF